LAVLEIFSRDQDHGAVLLAETQAMKEMKQTPEALLWDWAGGKEGYASGWQIGSQEF